MEPPAAPLSVGAFLNTRLELRQHIVSELANGEPPLWKRFAALIQRQAPAITADWIRDIQTNHPHNHALQSEAFLDRYCQFQQATVDNLISSLREVGLERLSEQIRLELAGIAHVSRPCIVKKAPKLKTSELPPLISSSGRVYGRKSLLKELKAYALAKREAQEMAIVVLSSPPGLPGGTGKTTLARKLAMKLRKYCTGSDVEVKLFGGAGDIVRSLTPTQAKRAVLSRLNKVSKVEGEVTDDAVNFAYQALFNDKKALYDGILLLDDAINTEQVEELLPTSPECVVIITTRHLVTLARHSHESRLIPTLDKTDSQAWLSEVMNLTLHRTLRPEEQAHLRELAELCSGIALALQFIAHHIAKYARTLILPELLAQYRQDRGKFHSQLDASLSSSFALLESDELRQALCRCCAFQGIPFTREDFQAVFQAQQELSTQLDELEALGFLQLDSAHHYSLHDEVQRFLISIALREAQELDTTLDAWQQAAQLHWLACLHKAGHLHDSGNVIESLAEVKRVERGIRLASNSTFARVLKTFCLSADNAAFNDAFSGKDRVDMIRLIKQTLTSQHLDNATKQASMRIESHALWRCGQSSRTVEIEEELLEVMKRDHGEQSREYASALLNVAITLTTLMNDMKCAKEEYAVRADSYFQQATNLYTLLVMQNQLDVFQFRKGLAATQTQYARLYIRQDKHQEALALLKRAYEFQRTLLGDHPETATTLHHLGHAFACSDPVESEKMHRASYEMRRKLLGDQHPSVLISLSGWGNQLMANGNFIEAEKYLRQAFDLQSTTLGIGHPDTERSLKRMIALLKKLRRFDEAEKLISLKKP